MELMGLILPAHQSNPLPPELAAANGSQCFQVAVKSQLVVQTPAPLIIYISNYIQLDHGVLNI
jgi:hypothetical protein